MNTRNSITTACAALALALPAVAHAQRQAEPQLHVSYPTDAAMTCDQLTAEIARMEQISGVSAQNAENARGQGAMADGATSVALTAALHSGVLGRVPGLGMFANAAGAAARRSAEARAQAEAERIQTADQRRTLLSGIYQGRQCGVAPPPAPAPAATPVAAPAADASPPAPPVAAPAVEATPTQTPAAAGA